MASITFIAHLLKLYNWSFGSARSYNISDIPNFFETGQIVNTFGENESNNSWIASVRKNWTTDDKFGFPKSVHPVVTKMDLC
jgi:hypothetical protein